VCAYLLWSLCLVWVSTPSLTPCFCVNIFVRARGSKLWRFLANGIKKSKAKHRGIQVGLWTTWGLVRFHLNSYRLRGIERVSILNKSKSLSIRINPLQSIWIENNRTSPHGGSFQSERSWLDGRVRWIKSHGRLWFLGQRGQLQRILSVLNVKRCFYYPTCLCSDPPSVAHLTL
jgi:hypothetical protein